MHSSCDEALSSSPSRLFTSTASPSLTVGHVVYVGNKHTADGRDFDTCISGPHSSMATFDSQSASTSPHTCDRTNPTERHFPAFYNFNTVTYCMQPRQSSLLSNSPSCASQLNPLPLLIMPTGLLYQNIPHDLICSYGQDARFPINNISTWWSNAKASTHVAGFVLFRRYSCDVASRTDCKAGYWHD